MDSDRKEEYEKIFAEKLIYLKKLNSKPVETWTFEAEKDGVTVYSIIDERTGLKIIRAHITFNAPASTMVEVAEEIDPILEWDKTLETARPLHRAKDSDDCNIIYMLTKKIPFIVQRESIVIARFIYDADGTIYGIGASIKDYAGVEESVYVRAEAYLIGWTLKPDPNDPEKTELTYILNIDPKGWIPKPAFNWFVHNQGFNVKPFAEYVEARYKKNPLKYKTKAGTGVRVGVEEKKEEKPRLKQPLEQRKEEQELLSPTGKL